LKLSFVLTLKIKIFKGDTKEFVRGQTKYIIEMSPYKTRLARYANSYKLRSFVRECDVIVHLAAMNRHPDPQVLYDTNIGLVSQLISAMEAEKVTPHVLFSSSTQEERDNEYGRSKREGRNLLEEWAGRNRASFTGSGCS